MILDIAGLANSISIDNQGTNLQVPAGKSLTLFNGLNNNGLVTVSGSGPSLCDIYFDGTQTISGGGGVLLVPNPYLSFWRYQTSVQLSGTVTQTTGHTIGVGILSNVGSGSPYLLNQGLINANVPGQAISFSGVWR